MPSQDLAFEALAEVTGTDWEVGRGKLNAALRDIKKQWQGDISQLPDEIRARARLYRRMMPDVVLTPNALANHWLRVVAERTPARSTNQGETCHHGVSFFDRCDRCLEEA